MIDAIVMSRLQLLALQVSTMQEQVLAFQAQAKKLPKVCCPVDVGVQIPDCMEHLIYASTEVVQIKASCAVVF